VRPINPVGGTKRVGERRRERRIVVSEKAYEMLQLRKIWHEHEEGRPISFNELLKEALEEYLRRRGK